MTSPIPDVTARIRVDTSSIDRAKNAVQEFGRSLDRSSSNADRAGTRITGALKFPALISGASLAATAVSALGAGFVALVGAAAPAAGVLAALPVSLTAGAQAAGVAALAFRGIRDAVKSLGKVQAAQASDSAAAGAAATASARAQEAAARGVEQAERALTKARQGAKRAAAEAFRQVTEASEESERAQVDAAQRVQRAEESASEAIIEAGQRTASARRAVDQAREAAIEGVDRALEQQERAERDVTSAQADALRAQESLTDARRTAQERIETLTQRLAGAALDERRATLSLAQARADLAETEGDTDATELQREAARLRVDEALQGLADLERANARLRAEQAAAAQAGVEGADVVRTAQERVATATANVATQQREARDAAQAVGQAQAEGAERVAEATARLVEAQREGARDVRLAQQAVTAAQREGAEQVAEAQQRVTDAVADQRQQQQDSASAIVDAQRGVQDALRAVADAQASAGAAGASSTATLLAGYNELSPAAQRFATFLAGPGKRALDGLSDTAATAFLPLLQTALERVVAVAPRLTGVVDATGGALGRLALATADVAVAQMPLLERVLLANVPLLETMGTAGLVLAPAFLQVVAAAQPMTQLLAEAALQGARFVAAAVDAGVESGRLAGFFQRAYDTAAQLGRILADLAVGIFQVFSGGAESGGRFLDSIEKVSQRFRDFTTSAEGQNKIAAYFREAEPVVEEAARLVGAVAAAFGGLANNTTLAPILRQLRTEFLPVLEAIFAKSTEAFAPALITLATEALETFGELAVAGGPLLTMVKVLTSIVDVVGDILEKNPALVTLIGTFTAISLGITGLRIVLGPLTAAYGLASAAVGLFTSSTTASTVATTVNGVTTTAHTTITKASTVSLVAQRAAQIASTIATGAATVATGILTAAQTALNIVLRANPIGLVVTALALLAAGVVIAYKESETFRRIVDGAFGAVAKAGKAMWEDVLRPAFEALLKGFLAVGEGILKGADKAFGWIPGIGPKISEANRQFSEFAQSTNRALDAIKDKDIKVSATATLLGAGRNADGSYRIAGQGSQGGVALATGGAVRGPGTRTSDSVNARLSNDEHVWTAAEVDGAGGHGVVERLRTVAKRGMLPGFARGGRVQFEQTLPDPDDLARPVRGLVDGLSDAVTRAAAALAQQAADSEGTQSSPAGRGQLGPRARTAYDAVRDIFGFTGTIGGYSNRNIAGTNTLSKHALGKAIDVMTYSNKALGQRIADFFVANRGTYGVDNVIFNRRIANARRGWNYGAYNGQNPHLDHPHIDFFDRGGVARGLGYMPKLTSAPERVLSPVQTESFERLVDLLPTLVGGQTDALLRQLLVATQENTQAVRSAPLAAVDRSSMYGRKGVA